MAVQLEIKSQLAKLLATEDLVVEHKQVSSAQFNVHTRVLTLPLWEKASNTVYDLLVGHEVGHALFTPDEDFGNVPHQFVNVVEDARIEKLMKRKYMGLAKTFYKGYEELSDEDFFELEDQDISTFNLADRANLYFKIGNYISIDFCVKEQEIIDMIGRCETFEDAKKAAFVLYEYCKQKKKEEEKDQEVKSNQEGNSVPQDANREEGEEGDTLDETEDGEDKKSNEGASDDKKDELDVNTANSLSNNLENLTNNNGDENVYVEFPDVDLKSIIASNEDFHKECEDSFKEQQENADISRAKYFEDTKDLFKKPDASFNEFKKNAQKEVNYLVKEFECRKAADNYARSSINRTGVLSTKKLHTYKFNEDLFKKITTVSDGKNHGLVFILDWSGSMANVLEDTMKQLYNLVWFCRKVSIPFEVYAFSNTWNSYKNRNEVPIEHAKREAGKFHIDREFALMNILTHRTNSKTIDRQMKIIWRLSNYYKNYPLYNVPSRAQLSGTPLNESLVALYKILPKFQKDNNLQKVQCVILTDGEANQLPYYVDIPTNDGNFRVGCRSVRPDKTFIRNRKTGRTYTFGYQWNNFTDACLRNIRDTYPSVNFIGIRVLANRDAIAFMKLYYTPYKSDHWIILEKLQCDWKKNKSFVINDSGYHAYIALSGTSLSNDDSFEVKEDATKSQIKNAFIKSLKTKKLNKKVLSEFISLIA